MPQSNMSDGTSSSRNTTAASSLSGTNNLFPLIPTISFEGLTPGSITMLQGDRLRVMHKRTIALFNENTYLREKIGQESQRAKEFEEKLSVVTQTFCIEESDGNKQKKFKNGNDKDAEAAEILPFDPLKKLQQAAWAVCKSCHRKLQKNELEEPVICITKTELELLEKDIQTLRGALASREQAWNKMVDREQSYCQQLTRLAQEVITANQLTDNRLQDLEKMAQTLEEKEFELKRAQKELTHLKKIIVKQEKRHKALENRNEAYNVGTERNDRDCKWIEGIVQQLSSPRRRQKSMGRQHNTPRHGSNKYSAR